mgnify:CR=1 FL=1
MLAVDRDLDVTLCQDGIGDVGNPSAAYRHRAAIGVGEGDLGLAALIHTPPQALVVLHALFEELNLLFELLGGELALFGLLGVVGVQFVQVGFDLPWPGHLCLQPRCRQDRLVEVYQALFEACGR